MDISGVAKPAGSIADTGTNQEVDAAILKKAMQVESATATTLVDAVQPTQATRLPEHLGNNVNTTA